MLNLSMNRKFAAGFVVGVIVCALAMLPAAIQGKKSADGLLNAAQSSRESLESCTKALTDLNSTWTLISDTTSTAVPTAQVFHRLMAISPGEAFTGAAQPVQRWMILARVRPVVYGPVNGARYFYWNPDTRELSGAHVPEVAGGQ